MADQLLTEASRIIHTSADVTCVAGELNWVSTCIARALSPTETTRVPSPPALKTFTAYGKLVTELQLSDIERAVFNVALAATFSPETLAPLAKAATDPKWTALTGGFFRKGTTQFVPTIRSAIFLLAGSDLAKRAHVTAWLHSKQRVFTSGVVVAEPGFEQNVFLDYSISFNDQFLATVLNGESPRLDGDQGFPARRSTRKHTLSEVVLAAKTKEEIEKLRRFTRHMRTIWEMNASKRYRNNFISIFSGEPGTGKSHTAEAIGNEFGLPVYKVNFAQMVSKYIGETEKNLEKVFDRFDRQPCILFFDEAESVFSKRTEVTDSHDQHANNMQSYLLQKIEEFSGVVVLATNVQNLFHHFDKAFQRRIRLIASFPFPDFPERLQLWNQSIESPFAFEEGLTEELARNYQLTGGSIFNVVSDAILDAMDRQTERISFELIEPALQDEFKKTGRKYEVCTDDMVMQNPVRRFGPGYEQRRNF